MEITIMIIIMITNNDNYNNTTKTTSATTTRTITTIISAYCADLYIWTYLVHAGDKLKSAAPRRLFQVICTSGTIHISSQLRWGLANYRSSSIWYSQTLCPIAYYKRGYRQLWPRSNCSMYRLDDFVPGAVLWIGRHIGIWWRIYASVNWVIIVSGNGLAPNRRQVITLTSDEIASFGLPKIKLRKNWFTIQNVSGEKCLWKHLLLCIRYFVHVI